MWYLMLLPVPVAAVLMIAVARFSPLTATDRACSAIDMRLDREAELFDRGPAQSGSPLVEQHASRVTVRPARVGSELLAS